MIMSKLRSRRFRNTANSFPYKPSLLKTSMCVFMHLTTYLVKAKNKTANFSKATNQTAGFSEIQDSGNSEFMQKPGGVCDKTNFESVDVIN